MPPLQEVSNVKVVEPTHTTYQSQPAPEKIKSSPTPNTGVLTGKSGQIQKTHDTINQISTDFQAAKEAGVKEITVRDANGNVIGTVNPQNVAQARLQYLNLTKQGAVKYEYQTTTSSGQSGVTSTLTTYKPMNVLTAFTGGALGGFAELGLIGLGLVAKATGKSITLPGTNYTAQPKGVVEQAQEKVQKTFGRETLDKMISGEKVDLTNPLELASLTGFGASVIATGGLGGVKAVISAPEKIVSALRSPSIAKTVFTKEFQEGASLSQLQKVKGSSSVFEMEQASIQKAPKQVKETIQVQRLPSGKVQAVKVQTPIEQGIETTKEPVIPYGVIQATSKGTTSLVTKVSNLTPQEVAIKGLPLEVGQAMGLTRIANTGGFPIFRGKITAKNLPILMEEINKGNIKPTFDILQYPTKDIAKGGGRYGLLSRNENIISSNAFERVTRPSIIRYFESKVELEKGIKTPSKTGTTSTQMGVGSKGKQTLAKEEKPTLQKLSEEQKQLVKTVTKEDLIRQSGSLKSELVRTATKQTSYSGLRTGTKTETKQQTRQTSRKEIPPKVITREERIRNESFSGLIATTKSKQGSATTQKQSSTTRQVQRQITIPKEVTPNLDKPDIPDTNKKRSGFLPLFGTQSGGLGKVGKSGNRLGYIGNVPLTSIVGVYKRSEITYGNKAEKVSKSGSKQNFSGLGTKKSRKLL